AQASSSDRCVKRERKDAYNKHGKEVDSTRVNYRCCWLLIFALHAFCAAYYVVVAALYQYLQSTAVIWTVELYSLSIEVTAFAFITALNALFAAGHLWGVIKIVWHSVRDRQLTFSSTAHGQNQHPKADDRTSSSLGQNIWRTVSGRGGMLGIETEYYDLRLVMYETIEIVLQSCQCYRMSWFLSRMWLQHLHMGLIVVNCWIGALVHLLNRRHHTNHENAARTRVKLVLIDMLLDIVSTIVIPCVLFKTYYDQYDAVSTDFPLSFYYNDLSLMSFLNEFQFLLVNNKYDLVMRLAREYGKHQGDVTAHRWSNDDCPHISTNIIYTPANGTNPTTTNTLAPS
ncbi:TPA: hypothetical protein N0F65_005480, partial [Lagenidium giganteum]